VRPLALAPVDQRRLPVCIHDDSDLWTAGPLDHCVASICHAILTIELFIVEARTTASWPPLQLRLVLADVIIGVGGQALWYATWLRSVIRSRVFMMICGKVCIVRLNSRGLASIHRLSMRGLAMQVLREPLAEGHII